MRGDIPLFGRHSHTACEYKGSVVIFGGERKYNSILAIRETLNDVYMFNPDKAEWKYLKSIGRPIEHRRGHSATIWDKYMYVYGGINSEGKYLRDLWHFNFSMCLL